MERLELVEGYDIPRVICACPSFADCSARTGDRDALLDLWSAMVGSGATAFDCSDGGSEAEELVAVLYRRLRQRSSDAEGVGLQLHTALAPDRDLLPKISRRWVVDQIDRSLQRLQIERLDLVQLHWWDFGVAGYLPVAQWLSDLQREGKIGHVGVANFDVPHLLQLLAAGVPAVSNLVSYSLIDRRPDNGMVDVCRERGIKLLAYGSLAGGFLSSRYERCAVPPASLADAILTRYRLLVEEFGGWALVQDLLEVLRQVADKYGVEPETVAARYVLERDQVASLVVGLEAAVNQLDRLFTFGLDDEDYAALETIVSHAEGPRGDVFASERSPGGSYASVLTQTRSGQGW